MVGWLAGWLGGRWYVVIKFTCITVVVVVVLKLMLDDSVFWVPFALMVLMMFWAARFFSSLLISRRPYGSFRRLYG